MGKFRDMFYAAITLLFIAFCFIISLIAFYGAAIIVYRILEALGLTRKGLTYDLILSWDMCANVLIGGDEQVRVSDRLYYWDEQGCVVATYMRQVVDALFMLINEPNHCHGSYYANPMCAEGIQVPKPFPLFNIHDHATDGCDAN